MIRAIRQLRWWIPNRVDGLRVRVRFALGLNLCEEHNPLIPSMSCDKKRGHSGDHRSRAICGSVKRRAA